MLEVRNLKKKFGDHLVLKGIDLTVEKGDKIAIIGPSGCGKSTFLRCLNGIETPTSGEVIFEGTSIHYHHDLSNLRRKIGMVFQQFNLFSNLTVEENITLAPVKLKIMTMEEAKKKASDLLKSINLSEKKNNYPQELSGGEQQRGAIVRALIMNPKLLICDEPISALDVSIRAQIINLLNELKDELGLTIIFIAHDLSVVKYFCDRIAVMYYGKIVELASSDELFNFCSSLSLFMMINPC